MAELEDRIYTPEEYFALDEAEPWKLEYCKGRVSLMSYNSIRHTRISGNTLTALMKSLEDSDWRVLASRMRTYFEQPDFYTYPDIMVFDKKPTLAHGRKDTLMRPSVIVEIYSKETECADRGIRFERYRTAPPATYILIDENRVHVEYYSTLEYDWVYHVCDKPSDRIYCWYTEAELYLEQIYDRIDFDNKNEGE